MPPTPRVLAAAAEDRRTARLRAWLGFGALVLGSSVAAALVFVTGGNAFVVPAACVAVGFVFLLVRYLEVGVYVLLAAVMVLDQFLVYGIQSPFALQSVKFFLNLNSSTGIGALVFNPVEALLALLVASWFIRATVTREWHLHSIPNFGVAVLFLLMLVFFTGYGLARGGGDWKAALWEIRPLYYLCFMYFLVSQIIRTPAQVRVCVWIIILGLAFRGLQGCWRYFITLHGSLGNLRAILGHEDSLFLVTGFILLAALSFLGYRGREWKVLAWTAVPNLLTFVFNQRRITFGVLGFCLGLVVLMLPRPQMRKALRFVLPAVMLFALYTAAFWNSSGAKAMPAQKVKSMFVKQEGTADDSSNEWRKLELLNLRATVRAYPQGIGFGQKYLVVVPYPDIGDLFPLWNYIPHCAIYWIWVKTGFAGFAIFWLFFGVAIAQSMIDYRAMRDAYFKSVALMVMMFIVGQVIVAYYDLQITYYRNMIYLGTAMALGTIVRRLDSQGTATAAGGTDGQ
jgi:hypothetical protein